MRVIADRGGADATLAESVFHVLQRDAREHRVELPALTRVSLAPFHPPAEIEATPVP